MQWNGSAWPTVPYMIKCLQCTTLIQANVVHLASIPFYCPAACSCCIASLASALLLPAAVAALQAAVAAPQAVLNTRTHRNHWDAAGSHCLNPAATHNVAQFVPSPAACSACMCNLAYAGMSCLCMTCQSAVAAHISAWFSRVNVVFSLTFEHMCKPVPTSSSEC
jgi:hypothetical protein